MKTKIPKPRLRARHLSSIGKSAYGSKAAPPGPGDAIGSAESPAPPGGVGAAFPTSPMAFPGGGDPTGGAGGGM